MKNRLLEFIPVWFDSMGAKSSCTLVKTPDVAVLIDPGIAAMQKGFPASNYKKMLWKREGKKAIKKAAKEADIIVISHYHHDHYFPDELEIYANKIIFAKNPNEYINDSQRKRAEQFYYKLFKKFGNIRNPEKTWEKQNKSYPDPLKEISVAVNRDFGDYTKRRKEILKKGVKWFSVLAEKWNSYLRIPEKDFGQLKIKFAEGKEFKFKNTKIRFTKPLFHGVEFSKLGWVFATVIEYKGEKLIHTSDLNGPIIEDYAEWIIKENPDILIIDGPMTYMFGYLLIRVNLKRAIENMVRIIENTNARLIIYDHHLPREKKFRQKTVEVWNKAEIENKKILTAAEFLGYQPKVLTL